MPKYPRSTPLFLALTTALLASTAPVFAHEPPAAHEGHGDEAVELDAVTVQSTRSGRRVSDEPIRVDVVSQEEIEEKQLMSPGNVSMLVAETAGVRVQNTSPGMGGSNIRIQGLRGRYTQLLADGLPLYGGQSSSIGLLQIPPTDLGSVEIIKGSASALYGPAALGGVVNLISRRPRDIRETEVLLNATSRGGQDLTGYVAGPLDGHWGLSMVGGYHRQDRQDLDGDGWADMPGYERMTLRPRVFWESEDGARALLTAGATRENRQGGTLLGRVVADGQPFTLTQHTERYDAGAVVDLPMRESDRLQLRASAMTTRHRHRYGASPENDTHQTGFAELSYGSGFGNTNWLAGVAAQQDRFRSRQFQSFDYRYTVPAVFVQAEQTLHDDLILSGSARWDEHSAYGNHFSPRLSLLFRPRDWTVRASLGKGFHAPTPFVEEIEAAGLSRLEPLQGLRAETATTGAIDVGYAQGAWEANLSLFASNIDHAIRLVDSTTMPGERVQLVNVQGMTRTRGSELLLRYRWQDVTVTGSYVYTDAREPGLEELAAGRSHGLHATLPDWSRCGSSMAGAGWALRRTTPASRHWMTTRGASAAGRM
ncbi:TonB-dependent receptor [Stenotrophomonas sp. CD2]|nr:TonB-dependent receptor [Stenotrophomonas sp. CD2]